MWGGGGGIMEENCCFCISVLFMRHRWFEQNGLYKAAKKLIVYYM